jgi:hypothetical protein
MAFLLRQSVQNGGSVTFGAIAVEQSYSEVMIAMSGRAGFVKPKGIDPFMPTLHTLAPASFRNMPHRWGTFQDNLVYDSPGTATRGGTVDPLYGEGKMVAIHYSPNLYDAGQISVAAGDGFICFGHGMFSEGNVALPISPFYGYPGPDGAYIGRSTKNFYGAAQFDGRYGVFIRPFKGMPATASVHLKILNPNGSTLTDKWLWAAQSTGNTYEFYGAAIEAEIATFAALPLQVRQNALISVTGRAQVTGELEPVSSFISANGRNIHDQIIGEMDYLAFSAFYPAFGVGPLETVEFTVQLGATPPIVVDPPL